MLQTTVNYLSVLENKRHNLVTESQGAEQIKINWSSLEEQKRHNVATEELGWASLSETSRHNVVSESINQFDAETRRQQLDINWYNADTQRYAAVQSAGIGWANVAVNQQNADTSLMRAQNDYEISSRKVEIEQQQADTAAANEKVREAELAERTAYDAVSSKTNRMNAEANLQNAQTRQNEYDLAESKQTHEIIWGYGHMVKEGSETVQNAANTARTVFNLGLAMWNIVGG